MEEITDHTTWMSLLGTVVLAVIFLFRDAQFLTFLTQIRHHRSKEDDLLIKELKREKDITDAFMEMVEDDTLVIKYKTLQRVMKGKGKLKKE